MDVLLEKWPIPTEFPITVAADEVTKFTYYTEVGKSGCKYYIPVDSDHPADNIYVTESSNWNETGRGFGGRTLRMQVVNEDGTDVKHEDLKGGWHSNAEALYQDTGVDIRDKHKTFVVIAKSRDAEYLFDVMYHDTEPQISEFRRGDNMAKKIAQELNTSVVSFSRSSGGAVIGVVYP